MTALRTITAFVRRARQALAEGRTTYAAALVWTPVQRARLYVRLMEDDMNHGAHPHPLEGLLEPACRDVQTPMECAALSVAISLKRIADQLDGIGQSSRDATSLADVINAMPYFLNGYGGRHE